MTLLAFVDESLRPEGDLVCVAAYLFEPSLYDEFCRQWQYLLNVTKGAPLHMTHLVNGKAPFDNLALSSRVLATEVAVDLINRHVVTGLAMTISRAEFRKVLPTDEWERRLGSLYSLLCKTLVETAGRWLLDNNIAEDVRWSFGAGYETEKETDLILEALIADTDLDWAKKNRLADYAFSGTVTPGHQAADLFAWANTLALSVASIRDKAKLQPFMDEVARLKSDAWYRTGTISGDGLRKLIDLNLNNPDKKVYQIPGLAKLKTKL